MTQSIVPVEIYQLRRGLDTPQNAYKLKELQKQDLKELQKQDLKERGAIGDLIAVRRIPEIRFFPHMSVLKGESLPHRRE